MTTYDRDALIKAAISIPPTVEAPFDLGDAIFREIQVTRQDRGFAGLARLVGTRRPTLAFVGVALLVLAALALIATALSRPPLPPHLLGQYHGGPGRTGIMVGPGPNGVPVIAWDVTRPGPFPFTTMPLVQDGRVYVADASGSLAALDAATGSVVWQVTIGAPARGTPALIGDLLIIATDAGDVMARSTADGSLVWNRTVSTAAVSASTLEAGGTVYVGSEDGTFAALDGKSGSLLWSINAGGPVTRGAAMADGVVYVGATGGRFSAIDTATGAERWHLELGSGEVGTPIVASDTVYVGRGLLTASGPHDMVAISRIGPAVVWSFAAPTGRQVYPGALANGLLYCVSDDGSMYALDPGTGGQRWTVAAASSQLGTLASVVGNAVYVTTSDRTVQAYDSTTGAKLWTVDVAGVPTMAAVVDGSLFVGTSLGHVSAIRDAAPGASPGGS